MSHPRYFLTEEIASGFSGVLPLSDEDAHHAARVARVAAGEFVEAVTPLGTMLTCVVRGVRDASVVVDVVAVTPAVSGPRIVLYQGVAKGEKMDAIVRQSVEAGVSAVVPVITIRTVVKLDDEKRAERRNRWRRVAKAASEQSRRAMLVEVAEPVVFTDALHALASDAASIVLWEEPGGAELLDVAESAFRGGADEIALWVGPEGGFSEEEVAALQQHGATIATMGPTILRAETAAVVAVASAAAAGRRAGNRGGDLR